MIDPYFESTFFEWFSILFSRIISLRILDPVPDEIQLFVMGLFAMSASFLGVFLVLKRITMMTNSLSHTMLLGIVIAIIIATPRGDGVVGSAAPSDVVVIIASLIVGFLTGFLTQQLTAVRLIKEDASNGMVFSALFALGVTMVSLWTRNAHAGSELLMGDPDALQIRDVPLVFAMACLTLVVGIVFLRGFTVAIFEPSFAVMAGFRPSLLIHLLLIQVALTSISAFRAVGFVMTLAFFVTPPLIARLWADTLRSLLLYSVFIGVGTVTVSVALGRHLFTVYYLPVSTGALAAVLLSILYLGTLSTKMILRRKRCGCLLIGNRS